MKRLSLAGVALLLVLLGWWWFSPTQQLKRRVHGMIDTANVPASMSDLARKTRGTHLADYLAARVKTRAPQDFFERVPASLSRDHAAAGYSWIAASCRRISLERLEFDEVAIEGDRGRVVFQVDGIIEMPTVTPVNGLLQIESTWIDDPELGWVMDSVAWRETSR